MRQRQRQRLFHYPFPECIFKPSVFPRHWSLTIPEEAVEDGKGRVLAERHRGEGGAAAFAVYVGGTAGGSVPHGTHLLLRGFRGRLQPQRVLDSGALRVLGQLPRRFRHRRLPRRKLPSRPRAAAAKPRGPQHPVLLLPSIHVPFLHVACSHLQLSPFLLHFFLTLPHPPERFFPGP